MILLNKLLRANNENGFTLIETLVVLLILSVLIGISFFGLGCYIKTTDYNERLTNARIIQTSILNSVADSNGSYPVKELAKADKLVLNNLSKTMGKISVAFATNNQYNNFIYTIDKSKVNYDEKLNPIDLTDYYVFYVDESNSSYGQVRNYLITNNIVTEEKVDSVLKSFNGTVLFSDYLNTCFDNDLDNFVSGKSNYDNISEGLQFEISDEFLNCPRDGLCVN